MCQRWRRVLLVVLLVSGWSAGGAPAQDKTAPKKEAVDKEAVLLETLGALAGAQLYQTYLNIGFIADGKAEGTYSEKEIQQILNSVLTLMDSLDKKLQGLGKLDLAKEDREGIEQIRKLTGLLRVQADELQAYWKTGDKAHADKY